MRGGGRGASTVGSITHHARPAARRPTPCPSSSSRPPQVPDSFSVERTYVLFRTMGLRHLIVVDEQHTVKGMVTRKDLLGYRWGQGCGGTGVVVHACMGGGGRGRGARRVAGARASAVGGRE